MDSVQDKASWGCSAGWRQALRPDERWCGSPDGAVGLCNETHPSAPSQSGESGSWHGKWNLDNNSLSSGSTQYRLGNIFGLFKIRLEKKILSMLYAVVQRTFAFTFVFFLCSLMKNKFSEMR